MKALKRLELAARGWPGWQAATKDPKAAQAKGWKRISSLLSNGTFWPQRLESEDIPPLESFDPTSYDDYADAFSRSFQRTHSELNGEAIRRWVTSSGSTGPTKMFPWTDASRAEFEEAAALPLPMVVASAKICGKKGDSLLFVAPTAQEHSPAGVPIGYASSTLEPPDGSIYPLIVNDTPELFRVWMPLYALAANLNSITVITAERVFMLLEQLDQDREFYLSHLRGDRPMPDGLPAPRVSEERLAHVKRVLESNEPLVLDTLWPNLRLIHTWLAGPAGLQAQRLKQHASPQLRFMDAGYNATEGSICNPVDPDAIGGPIHPGTAIHEFLEPGAALTADNVLKPWDLQPGRSYEVLLTTSMGLVRYRLRDVVKCTGFYQQTPTIHYQRRVGGELSLGAATFAEHELIEVMGAQSLPSNTGWVFAPSEDGRALVLYTDQEVPAEVVRKIDAHLLKVNGSYASLSGVGMARQLSQQTLSPDAEIWRHCASRHNQGKPRVLLMEPPSAYEDR